MLKTAAECNERWQESRRSASCGANPRDDPLEMKGSGMSWGPENRT